MCVFEKYRVALACQQNQKQERLIWTDKSTELQITAGYETAWMYFLGKLVLGNTVSHVIYIYHLQVFVLQSHKQ